MSHSKGKAHQEWTSLKSLRKSYTWNARWWIDSQPRSGYKVGIFSMYLYRYCQYLSMQPEVVTCLQVRSTAQTGCIVWSKMAFCWGELSGWLKRRRRVTGRYMVKMLCHSSALGVLAAASPKLCRTDLTQDDVIMCLTTWWNFLKTLGVIIFMACLVNFIGCLRHYKMQQSV